MEIGIIGLGKMGFNIALNAIDNDNVIIGYDLNEDIRNEGSSHFKVAESIDDLIDKLERPRRLLLSLPAGEITKETVKELSVKLHQDDIIIDCGNSRFTESLKNYEILKEKNIGFIDCGTSGGMSGARYGACLMVGGEKSVYKKVETFLESIACQNGLLYTGEPGSGHYLKMVHNGIEYGMMQAIGEGFALLNACEFDYDFEKVSKVWNNGSVIRSWLIELAQEGFSKDPKLESHSGIINANGECKWTVEEALRLDVPVPVISDSLFVRNESQIDVDNNFSNKVVAQLRNGFGGHSLVDKKGNEQ